METKTINVYEFDELSDQAKEYAISNYKDGNDEYFWMDEWSASLKEFAREFGIKHDYAVSPYSYSYCTMKENNFTQEQEELTEIRLRTFILNNFYHILYERKPYGKYEKRENSKWKYDRYSKIQYIETCCPFTGYCGDDDIIHPMREFIKNPYNITLKELIEDCLEAWKAGIVGDMEYQDSDEFAEDEILSRGITFLETGEIESY